MSETLTKTEALLEAPEHHELLTAFAETAHVDTAKENARQHEQLENARQSAQELAQAAHATELGQTLIEENEAAVQPQQLNRELKEITLRRELQLIRRKLPTPARTLSKVIHQPVVRAVSEAAGQTVSRPSGLLGGGLVAFLGTSIYLYLAQHIGFRYNYVVFLVLFVGGFFIGLILELLVHLATASRRKAD